ncbi:MAG: LPXTG cell wall anchor domain-containing protein [Candidatus Sulfotelmatobacter sp.]
MNSRTNWTRTSLVLLVGIVCVAFALNMSAQVQTKTTTTSGPAAVTTHVENGEIVFVSGNSVVVKMSDGTLRHFDNVPESARVTVDGQQLGVHDLKVGMKVQKTITTTTTPETVTTVKSVTGKVWFVNPPSTVILTMEDGKNQEFKIPNGQKFDVNGQMVDAWGLKKGMTVNATKVVEAPATVIAQHQKLTGEMPPPPPPPPPADVPILVVEEVAVPVQVAQAPAPAPVLPKTGSELPLVGLLGLLSLASSLGLRTARKSR